MKKHNLILVILVSFFFSGLSGCVEPKVTDYFNGEYETNEHTVLKVTTLNGQIEITSWDGETVLFNAIKKSKFGQEELDKVKINVVESENRIEIETKYTGQRTTSPSVDMNIKVPRNITVESATTSNGAVQISETKGNIFATTSNGVIIIENVDGYVSATTSNGRIEVNGTTGIKDLKSSNGGIYAEIYDFQENLSVSTSNGGITIYMNPSLNTNIEMTTSNGQITISGISLNFTISEEKHKVGRLGDGGNTIDIHTSNGNINLHKLTI